MTTNATCPENLCDGLGIMFTQSLEQGGHADADNVRLCPACGPSRFGGYPAVYVARRLAERLLEDLPESDLDRNRRAFTQVVCCYGDDPDEPVLVGIREDVAEASLFGHENSPGGAFLTEVVTHERAARWSQPHEAMLDLGDSIRVLLDARDVNGLVLSGTYRDTAQGILDAAEFLLERVPVLQVPALRQPDRAMIEAEESAHAAGLFVALVQVAEAYTRAIGGRSSDALHSMLQGLAENLEDEFGPT